MKKRFKKPYGGGYRTFYMPTTKRGNKNKRDRRRCTFYNNESKFCIKIWARCVGPTLCNKYIPKEKNG